MQIGIKIILLFIVINVILFSSLNVIIVNYHAEAVESIYIEKADLQVNLYLQNKKKSSLPDYIIESKGPLFKTGFIPIKTVKDKIFYYLNTEAYDKDLKRFVWLVFFLEVSFFLTVTFFIYLTLSRFIYKLKDSENFLNLLLLSFNHKIGNFLSHQRINIEILKSLDMEEMEAKKAISRLESAHNKVESNMKRTLSILKEKSAHIYEHINLYDIVSDTLILLKDEFEGKKVVLDVRDCNIFSNANDIEDIFYNLLENASKYSITNVNIGLFSDKKFAYLTIENDVADSSKRGTGLGLEIVNKLIKKHRGSIKKIVSDDKFLVQIKIPVKNRPKAGD